MSDIGWIAGSAMYEVERYHTDPDCGQLGRADHVEERNLQYLRRSDVPECRACSGEMYRERGPTKGLARQLYEMHADDVTGVTAND